ncbi:MAG: hypothetical protein IPL47_14835 [Phyllobacteriaceae bacterium]|nr:hypothetical protein [Phyllobacteriaceae bacterium]
MTQKAPDYAGKQQGMTAVDAANQRPRRFSAVHAGAIVEPGIHRAGLRPPSTPSSTIRKSIEIAAKPASPPPFAMPMAARQGDPKAPITTPGVTVKANE